VKDLIHPAEADMAGTMLREKAKKTMQTMPLSDTTVSRHISDMAGDVLKQLLLFIQANELYTLQLDESKDMAGLAQLQVYVRYVYGRSIKEDILFWKPGQHERTFLNYWTALLHQMNFGSQDMLVSVLKA
jgi:hypothetical protein